MNSRFLLNRRPSREDSSAGFSALRFPNAEKRRGGSAAVVMMQLVESKPPPMNKRHNIRMARPDLFFMIMVLLSVTGLVWPGRSVLDPTQDLPENPMTFGPVWGQARLFVQLRP